MAYTSAAGSTGSPPGNEPDLARLVADPELAGVSGRYFEGEKEVRSSVLSYDRENAAELWETSAELVGLDAEKTVSRTEDQAPKRR